MPHPPVPRDCSLGGRLRAATEFNPKVGLAAETGELNTELAASYSPGAESWTFNAGASAFGFGVNASRNLTTGNRPPDSVDPNPTFTVSTRATEANTVTGETRPSTSIKVGGAFIVGADVSFDLKKFNEISAACSQKSHF